MDGAHLDVVLPRHLAAPVRVGLGEVVVGVVPASLGTTRGWLEPLVVPVVSGQADVVLLFENPVAMPPMRRWMEADTTLPFTRAEVAAGLIEIDGIALPARDAEGLVAQLHDAGVALVDDVRATVTRRRRNARAAGREGLDLPPAWHDGTVTGLHLAALLEIGAMWQLDAFLQPELWTLLGATLAAATAVRPVLARVHVRRALARRAAESARARRLRALA